MRQESSIRMAIRKVESTFLYDGTFAQMFSGSLRIAGKEETRDGDFKTVDRG